MYIYLGKYFHRNGTDMSNIVERKIGKTNNLNRREYELNDTKMPIGYTIVQAWKTGDRTDDIERAIHALLDHDRMSGEWFNDRDDSLGARLSKFMKYQGIQEEDLPDDEDPIANQTRRIAKDRTKEDELKSKINEYLTGEQFTWTRPHNFVQTITIQTDGIHCDTNNKLYGIGKVHFAFADSFRQKLIDEGKITAEDWNSKQVRDDHRGPSVNFWYKAKDKNGKSIIDRLNEVDQSRKDVILKNE